MNYFKKYIKIKKGLDSPLELIIFISDNCNLKCRHCFWWKIKEKNEISLDNYKKIAKSLKYPLENLRLTGGESFLRNDIVEICKIFTYLNKSKSITISTNGFLTEKIVSNVEKIREIQPNIRINVSLDGLKHTHDSIRGVKGSFDKACDTIKKLKENKISVSVISVLTNENQNEIFKLSEFVKNDLNVPFYCEIIRGEPRISKIKPPDFNSNFLDIETCGGILKKYQRNIMKMKFDVLSGKEIFKCVAGNYIGVIYSNGDVSICELIKPFSNLKETNFDFYELWKRKNKVPNNCQCTHGCFLGPSVYYSPMKIIRFF